MARVAAIDIGTNSVKMSIADVAAGTDIVIVRESTEITRLGKGVDASKRLAPEAVERTLAVISRFADEAQNAGAERVAVVGTSALRDAENGQDFIDELQRRTGLTLEIIAGKREAQLAYRAVRSDKSLALPEYNLLAVFDIGGGSSEINVGLGNELMLHESLDLGAVRLTERFLKSDPPTDAELSAAREMTQAMFAKVAVPPGRLVAVGIGGTVVNVAAVSSGGDDGPARQDDGERVTSCARLRTGTRRRHHRRFDNLGRSDSALRSKGLKSEHAGVEIWAFERDDGLTKGRDFVKPMKSRFVSRDRRLVDMFRF